MPRVSVIMAVYNASLFVEEAIASVIQQTFRDIELIVVDDASTDNSLALITKASIADKRVKVLSLATNSGAAAARNLAIKHAKGEWLAVLDADDLYVSQKIERQLAVIDESNQNLILIGTNSFQIDRRGQILSSQHYPLDDQSLRNALKYRKRFPPHSSLMYRSSVVQSVGGFNKRFESAEDYDLWLRLLRMGTMALVSEPLVHYRLHDLNISKTDNGMAVLKFGMAALVCYFLRVNGHYDPSQDPENENWDNFLEWVTGRLYALQYDNFTTIKALAKSDYSQTSNTFLGLFKFSAKLIRSGHFGTFVSERLFESKLAQKLAAEWLEREVPCAES